jgi:hypothetical protein
MKNNIFLKLSVKDGELMDAILYIQKLKNRNGEL